ncbi:MarR family transcriptional regulator [Candidatus Saccharibacteria bacterium]|nr:MarR family transcriptional regulator [Candidatus Saccharibacteria bacterium]
MSKSRRELIGEAYQARLRTDMAFRSKKLPSIKGIEFGIPQLEILFCLDHYGQSGASIKQLCTITHKTSSAITQLVEGLERTGHLSREHSNQDQRVVIVKLTALGRTHFEKFFENLITSIEEIVSPLSDQELIDLTQIDNKVADNILELDN